jgi:ABC-type iron transport system FetAB permease component
MMKNKAQIILIILCVIFFNSVNITCDLKDSSNTSIEMVVRAKFSPAIQTRYWIVQQFFHHEPSELLQKFSIFTNSFL